MPRLFAALLCAALVALPPAAMAQKADVPSWKLAPEKSRILFTGTQMRVPAKGEFRKFTADIRFSPDDLAGSKVTVTVDTASARAGNRDVDKELKKELWFQVDKYPTATFEVSRFVAKGDGNYEAIARLTIRDQTREVALPFKLDIAGNTAKAVGELQMKRLDYGVGRGEWKDTGIVADEVTVRIEIEATRQ
jgi:polyisoprenoid-binding protein YceI